MKFFIEIAPPTGPKDVQYIGVLGDGTFVVEAKTPEEAEAKLFDLLTETMETVVNRPATEGEVEHFAQSQGQTAQATDRATKIVAGLNEQTSQA